MSLLPGEILDMLPEDLKGILDEPAAPTPVPEGRRNLAPLFSSKSEDWTTPQWLFDSLHAEFNFSIDVAASIENAKCDLFLTKTDNALNLPWAPHRCWCNPPYGRNLGDWVKKAAEEREAGALSAMLLPARFDTKYWADHILAPADWLPFNRFSVGFRPGVEVRFVRGRLSFGDSENSAPFPGGVIDMGWCNVCGGTGVVAPGADIRANTKAVEGYCFIGSGPSSGMWAGASALGRK